MNKKYLILGIALLLAVGLTNMARANSFNDALNTLSNQLYWLRDRLTAQIQTIENPMGSHENSYTWIKEHEDRVKKFSYCSKDSDCYFPSHPCNCPGGFGQSKDATIAYCDNWKNIKDLVLNRKYSYRDIYPFPMACPAAVCPFSIGVSPNQLIPTRCNNGFCEIDTTKDINSKKYVILKSNGECTLVDVCKTKKTEVAETLRKTFETLEECNQYKPTIIKGLQSIKENMLKQLLTFRSKANIPTLPDVNTIKELQEQIEQLHTEISNEHAKRTTTTTTTGTISVTQLRQQRDNLLRQLATLQGKTTVSTLPNVNTVTELQAQIKQLLTEIAAIQASRRTTTTTNRLKYLCDSVKKTCTLVGSSAHSWTRLYNTKEECEDACKGTTTTTQPEAATDQWYKLTAHQGCNLDDFSRNCYGTNAAKNSGNEAKYCMNQYLLSQKIAFSDLTVFINEPIEGAATCMSCDCNKPDIYIKAKANIEKELNKIGFTKANSPKMPSKAIKPQLKEQMMACSVDTECTFAETSCCDCSRGGTYDTIKGINKKYSTGFSKQLADYCRDNMIVCRAENKCEYEKLPMEAFVITSCVSGRCQIAISIGGVDTQLEKPATPIDPIKNKTTVDLSQQELYYREDKDTNKIKYAIISSNDKSVCGDNICSLKENYLYKLDLTKSCSVHADKVINFSHCHQDCKNATDQLTGAGISKEEFNALELVCTSQPEKPKQPEKTNAKGMPQPAKPIAQMSQTEKNSYVMELQTFLIQLLTQLLNLMKK